MHRATRIKVEWVPGLFNGPVTSVGFAVGAGASQSLTLAPLHASHALFWGLVPGGCPTRVFRTSID